MSDNDHGKYEDAICNEHSNSALRRNQLTRAAKKLNMEFDERLHGMTKQDRDAVLDAMFPEEKDEPAS